MTNVSPADDPAWREFPAETADERAERIAAALSDFIRSHIMHFVHHSGNDRTMAEAMSKMVAELREGM